jgi:GxxExxY protein
MDIEELIKEIVSCAFEVRLRLKPGFLESVYKNALLIELRDRGIKAEEEYPLKVFYKEEVVGEFRADIMVEEKVIVELKAVQELHIAHEAQLVNYLTVTKSDTGLLINFGGPKLEVRRKYREYKKTK